MTVVLTKLINKSILTCSFPDMWKTAIVTQVQKYTQNSSLNNYQPISVLPVVSKIFLERIVFDCHLVKNDLLSHKQSGFRPERSTRTFCYMLLTHGLRQLMVESLWVLFFFFDLNKAFDFVDHKILLQKLTCYGVRGGALQWMQSFLHGRSQQLCVQGSLSSKGLINSWCPPGLYFGPIVVFTLCE